MKKLLSLLVISLFTIHAFACEKCENYDNADFQIKSVSVKHAVEIAATIWEIKVEGMAGNTTPTPAGQYGRQANTYAWGLQSICCGKW